VCGKVRDSIEAAVEGGRFGRVHGAHDRSVGQPFARTRVGSHPRFGLATLAFEARGVHNEISDNGKTGKRFEKKRTALVHKPIKPSHVGENDASVGTNGGGRGAASVATTERQAAVLVALNRFEKILNTGMAGQGA
jgi:hypothetical protein